MEALAGAVAIPMNVDAERCFAADAGAAGCSIEDYDPRDGSIDTLEVAIERVGAVADAATERGIALTARAENHLYGLGDLDDTIMRLQAYRETFDSDRSSP